MDYHSLVDVLTEAKAVPVKRSGEQHIAFPCFLAPYRREHKFAPDRKTHAWARISNTDESWSGCYICDYKMPMVRALKLACKHSPRFKEALRMAIACEREGGAHVEEELKLDYEPEDTDYTPIYADRYRKNLKEAMPWKWLKSKGVTGKSTKAFKVGLDTEAGSIIFPCIRRDGKIVGAQSRPVAENASKIKYVTTLRFKTGDHLFGEHLTGTEGLLDPDEIAVFEGPLDAMHAYEMKVNNSSAVWGSSISPGQARWMRHFGISTVWLLLDPDVAGQEGIEKSRDVMDTYYPEAAVYSPKLPADPKKMSTEQFREIITTRNEAWQKRGNRKSLERMLHRLTSSRRKGRLKKRS